jgi:predicted dehydrogenase
MPFRICVIGCGALSSQAHGPACRRYAERHPEVELAACCDLDAARAASYRQAHGFQRHYGDYRAMLASERPDAVCLMVPVDKTCELSCAVMELGFPLLMEKPPGLNRDECLAMIAAADRSGVPNQVAFNRRYTPLVQELRARLAAQFQPTDIQNLRYDFFRINRRDADFATTAIHGIDTASFIAGSPYRRVRCRYQELPALGPTVANIFMDCDLVSGATVQITFCPVTGVVIERATVNLFDHTYFLNLPIWQAYDSPGRLLHLQRGACVEDLAGGTLEGADLMYVAAGFYGENASFFDDLRAGRRPQGDLRSGLQAVEIADCLRQRRPEYVATSLTAP